MRIMIMNLIDATEMRSTFLDASNRREIKKQHHFREAEGGGIMLNDAGKRLLLNCLEKKLDASFLRGRKRITYRQLIADEIYAFQRMLVKGESYRPYKYY